MQREVSQFSRTRELPAAQIRRSLFLSWRDMKAKVEPEGSSSWLYSATARKLLFGRETREVFKIQSGVKIAIKSQDVLVRAAPASVSFTTRGPEKIQIAHSVSLVVGECGGVTKTVKITNRGEVATRVRVLGLHDPTSLNYRRERDPPGEIGVNAFNRHDQVVMDDVGDTTGVRVVSFSPRPSLIYMTKDRVRAGELLALGELPESSLGTSGSVILLTQHDLDLPPGATAELRSASLYHPNSLESALTAAASSRTAETDVEAESARRMEFASSSASMNFTFDWAKAALFAIEGEGNLAERLWSGVALSILRSDYFVNMAESMKRGLRRDGTVRYSGPTSAEQPERAGPVETSLYILSICAYLCLRAGDRKLIKRWYPHVKKIGLGLSRLVTDGLVPSSLESPDGWRRRLGSGFPTGYSAEVNLLAARALKDASTVAFLADKGSESAKFRELSVRLLNGVNERLREPESGALALNLDARGVVHKETTVDQAVGLSYFAQDQNLASSVVHRLMEKDFETGYGPRTVPFSSSLYYSPTYGEGQLGGYWTRAAVSHALLAYFSGYPSIGSLQLEKVGRLVHMEVERLGGIPGELPYWIDLERRQVAASGGSDPVAASRFIEGVVFGEAGLSLGPRGTSFKIPEASQLKWFLLHDIDLGLRRSLFVGRSVGGRAFVATTLDRDGVEGFPGSSGQGGAAISLSCFHESERLDTPAGLEGIIFWDDNSSLLCVGNPAGAPSTGLVRFTVKSKSLSAALFAQLAELQPETGLWASGERIKLLSRLELRVDLKPNSWKMIKVHTVGQ